MQESWPVSYNAAPYTWRYDAASHAWAWTSDRDGEEPSSDIVEKLNQKLAAEFGRQICIDLRSYFGADRVRALAQDMGIARTLVVRYPELAPILGCDPNIPVVAWSASPFSCKTLRDYFVQNSPILNPPSAIATLGSGPFEVSEFDDFLRSLSIDPCEPEEAVPEIVVGYEAWEPDRLDAIVRSRIGREMRVYSQEMFLCWLFTDDDPLQASPETLAAFRKGHSALEYLSDGWRGWVDSSSIGSGNSGSLGAMAEVGLLGCLGYHVGVTGVSKQRRRTILDWLFKTHVVPEFAGVPSDDWGGPNSSTRLHMIAFKISCHCKLRRRQSRANQEAIRDWEEDLEWLRATFYDGRFRFQWPDTFVR